MYPVSLEYKNKIKENNRTFRSAIQIQHSTGVFKLTDKDIVSGSLLYTESSQAGEEFTMGGTVMSDITFTILNKPEYVDIDFTGATVIPVISLLLAESYDTENYFLSAPQAAEFKEGGGTELWEDVPLGIFNIDDVYKTRNTIRIMAIDNMINLDKPYNLSSIIYPTTLYQIYTNICNVCDVQIGTTNFVNKDYLVNSHPGDDLTFRDVLGYVAELSGCFAKMNRIGALELKWYEPIDLTLTPANRFSFVPREDLVQIKGIMATIEGTTYLAGEIDYAIDLTNNPLLQDGYELALSNLFDSVGDLIFTPYESSWQGDPAIQAGDMITQIDRDGNVYNTIVTSSTYKYRGASSLSARGLPLKAKGYKGSTNRRIAEVKRKIEKDIGDVFSTLEQAQLNSTEMIANMLGGYIIEDKVNAILYIADNPDINLASKVWKYGIGGFGYSSTGKDGPYNTAVTADGSIFAMLISANIITADMVQTGILQSEDGSTWINLDNGSFNFKGVLQYVDGALTITSPDLDAVLTDANDYTDTQIATIPVVDTDDFAPKVFGGGLMEMSDSKGFVAYKDATKQEFTQLYPDGLFRVSGSGAVKKQYHFERYLNLIGTFASRMFTGDKSFSEIESVMGGMEQTVQLPDEFIGKDFKVLVEPYLGDGNFVHSSWEINTFQSLMSGQNVFELKDTAGNLWDGLNIAEMPALIKSTGTMRVKTYSVYKGSYISGPYITNTYVVRFKTKIDAIV